MFFIFKIKGGFLLEVKEFFTEILTKPIRYGVLVATLLTTLILFLFPYSLPSEMIFGSSLLTFLDKYSGIIFIVFIASFFLLICQAIPDLYNRFQRRKNVEGVKKIQEDLYKEPDVQQILLRLYRANGAPVSLVKNHQKVKLLEQYHMIVRVSDTIIFSGYDLDNAEFPYILQFETEKRIRKHLDK